MNNFGGKVNFLWSIAELLRDRFKRGKYQDVILPFTLLRRIICVLALLAIGHFQEEGGWSRIVCSCLSVRVLLPADAQNSLSHQPAYGYPLQLHLPPVLSGVLR
jgi:hypothetical protein